MFPLGFENTRVQQQQDPVILALQQQGLYTKHKYYGTILLCSTQNNQEKIVLPQALQIPAIAWYHIVMGHAGSTRIYQALNQFFFPPQLKAQVEEFTSTCDFCQINKTQGPGYGHVPPQNDVSLPWEEVAVDLIRPWNIKVPGLGELNIRALTCIDTATELAGLIRIDHRSAAHVTFKFEHE